MGNRTRQQVRDFFRQPAHGNPSKTGDGFHEVNASKHAIRRAKERYGLKLNQADLEEITRIIKSGNAEKLGVVQNKGTVFRVHYRDTEMVVAFTKRHSLIRTFLTEQMAKDLLQSRPQKG